ncbi:MAG: cupin-like domain-containing protein [Verrucomicrobiales bacterium]|nr:cupin-like domain-containing protein [Verrucomicrobiales bacterium]
MSVATPSKKSPFTKEWMEWIEENLEIAVPTGKMTDAMVDDGILRSEAEAMIRTLELVRSLKESKESSSSFQKAEWIFESLAHLDESAPTEIESRDKIGRDEFYSQFYFQNRPVLIESWRELDCLDTSLSWDSLRSRFHEETVEIQTERNQDLHYERNSHDHKSTIQFGEFLDAVLNDTESNDIYLTANNGERNRELFSEITDSSDWMPAFMDKQNVERKAFLWIGPKGTTTPLHHDLTNNLLLQVRGEKLVFLFPPCHYFRSYNDFHCYSDFDCESPDFDRFPQAKGINIRKCVLREGQMLFLPVGWWHQVKSLSPSISITAVNFQDSNEFTANYHTHYEIS